MTHMHCSIDHLPPQQPPQLSKITLFQSPPCTSVHSTMQNSNPGREQHSSKTTSTGCNILSPAIHHQPANHTECRQLQWTKYTLVAAVNTPIFINKHEARTDRTAGRKRITTTTRIHKHSVQRPLRNSASKIAVTSAVTTMHGTIHTT